MLELITSGGSVPIPDVDNDYCITHKQSGVDTLHFEISLYADVFPQLTEESYIYESSEQQTYVIRGISAVSETADVDCEINLDAWRDRVYVGYYNSTAAVATTMDAIVPSGWKMVYEVQDTQRRSVNLDAGGTPLDIALAAQESYGCSMRFDTKAKTCTVLYPDRHTVSGTMLTESAGMRRKPSRTGKSTDLVTRIYPIGADGLTIGSVNSGKNYVENHTYTDKIIWQVWKDERYEDAANLMQDAQAMVDSLATPAVSWEVDLCDLYRADPATWADHKIELHQRVQVAYGSTVITALVVEETVHPCHPENNTVSISNVMPSTISTLSSLRKMLNDQNSRYNTRIMASIQSKVNKITPDSIGAVSQAGLSDRLSGYATIENLSATNVNVSNLSADYAKFETTTTDKLTAVDASITNLDAKKLDTESAAIKYANIDFSNIGKAAFEYLYAQSGLIKDVVVGDGTITGELVGVTIKGDLIEGNTIKAEKLVIKGSDGLYYKLNTDGVTTEAEQTNENSLDGSHIMAKSITATKIAVNDLVAFDATIGGFNITSDAIYSGVKDSPTNTTRGIYMDSQGQLSVGDEANYLKYYKAEDGTYKLEISAGSIIMAANGETVGDAIDKAKATATTALETANAAKSSIDNLAVGGRNLLRGTKALNTDVTPTGEALVYDKYNDFACVPTIQAWNGISFDLPTVMTRYNLKSGDTLTYSVMVMVDFVPESDPRFTLYRALDTAIPLGYIHLEKNIWHKLSATFTLNDASASTKRTRIETGYYVDANYTFGDGNHMYFAAPKLELGNIATDWTPAPEDMATADDMTAASSRIEQLKDSITLSVTDGTVGNTAKIKLGIDDETREASIDLTGAVSFSDLSTAGKTTINGSNITTGTLSADRINVEDLMAQHLTSTGGLSVTGDFELQNGWASISKYSDAEYDGWLQISASGTTGLGQQDGLIRLRQGYVYIDTAGQGAIGSAGIKAGGGSVRINANKVVDIGAPTVEIGNTTSDITTGGVTIHEPIKIYKNSSSIVSLSDYILSVVDGTWEERY